MAESHGRADVVRALLLEHSVVGRVVADAAEVAEKYGDPVSTEALAKHIAQLEKSGPPGEGFHYSCHGFITLAFIIHKITDQTVAEFATEHIFAPLSVWQSIFVGTKT